MNDSLPLSRIPDPMDAPALAWGIMAPGTIARMFATAIGAFSRQRIVAVGSRNRERAAAFAADYGVEAAYGSYAELLADDRVQAVYVASPHSEHVQQALAAIQAGKHVLVEKAFTRNAAEARMLIDAAAAQQVTLMEAMWTRFLPRTDIVRQLLADGALGEIETVIGDHGLPLEHIERMVNPALAGGPLLDLGVYPIAYASFVLGRPGLVRASGELTDAGVDRQVTMTFAGYSEHPHARALLSTTMAAHTPVTFAICGTEARIELDRYFYHPGRVRLIYPDGRELVSAPDTLLAHQGLVYEATHFAGLVAEGRRESPLLPLSETLAIVETLDEIRAQLGVRYPGE